MFGHPKGLYVLFMTEMWERFSYYGMRAILVLFLISNVNGGLGWSQNEALTLYGWYTMMVYIVCIPGGILADRVFGHKRAVMIGALLLCAGHVFMIFPYINTFYIALSLIVLGSGMIKPNISTMVGELYEDGDQRRDSGFTIFYMGINIGAFFATLIVGYVGETYGWHIGFSLASIGMLTGFVFYLRGQKHLVHVGNITRKSSHESKVKIPLSTKEKDRLLVLSVAFLLALIFWMAFEQAGGFMNIYTFNFTDRNLFGYEVPASWLQSLNPFFIIIFGAVVARFWLKRAQAGKESSGIFKMSIGTIILGLGFVFMVLASLQKELNIDGEVIVKSGMYWLVFAYLFHTIGELFLSPVMLSYITKLAPKRYVATVFGVYFAVTGIANKLASEIGKQTEEFGDFAIFTGLVIFTITIGLIVLIFKNRLNRLTHKAEY